MTFDTDRGTLREFPTINYPVQKKEKAKMLSIKFNMENVAFEEDPQEEAFRILKGIMKKIERGQDCGPCMDINGNKCGEWFYCPPEKEEEE